MESEIIYFGCDENTAGTVDVLLDSDSEPEEENPNEIHFGCDENTVGTVDVLLNPDSEPEEKNSNEIHLGCEENTAGTIDVLMESDSEPEEENSNDTKTVQNEAGKKTRTFKIKIYVFSKFITRNNFK